MQLQQQLQQQMADRGMMDSGVAADTYMRGQMGMNQNYQQAYSDSANKKAQIESDYTDKTSALKRQYEDAINAAQMAKLAKTSETMDKINSAKMGQLDWNNQQDSAINNAKMGKLDKQSSTNSAINDVKNGKIAQQDAYNKAAYGANSDLNTAKANAQNTIAQQKYQQAKDALDRQDARDKFLTQQSGILYVNGKPVVGKDGKPLTTIDAQKVQETSRHNQATETLTSQKNAADYQLGSQKNAIAAQKVSNDYALGSQKNAIAGQKVAADLSKFSQTMQLNYAKLDYNYAKLDASNKQAQDKLGVAMDNAQTAADKNKIATVSKLLDNSTKQIMAYQKSGKKPPKQLVSDYNDALGKMKSLSDPGAASKSKSSSSKSSKSSKSKSSGTKSSTSLTGKSAPMYS